jgi:hypothetical protein
LCCDDLYNICICCLLSYFLCNGDNNVHVN